MINIMDVNKLFETLSVDEVKKLARKTRSDIEMKKEELRMLVGERYRDIILAADTISEMKQCSNKITDSLIRMNGLCDVWNSNLYHGNQSQSLRQKSLEVKDSSSNSSKASVAAQVKLLLSMSDMIWTVLEEERYVDLSVMFLAGQQVATHLQLGSEMNSAGVSAMGLVHRQWAALSQIKEAILSGCLASLEAANLSTQTTCDALATLVFLEELDSQEVLDKYLEARLRAIQSHLSTQESSVKDQIVGVITILLITIHHAYLIFNRNIDNGALLMKRLESSCKSPLKAINWFCQEPIYKCLPTAIADFHPQCSRIWADGNESLSFDSANWISEQNLQETISSWLNKSMDRIRDDTAGLLEHVTTVSGILSIRQAILSSFASNKGKQNAANNRRPSFLIEEKTKELSRSLVNPEVLDVVHKFVGDIDLWKELRELVLRRLEVILNSTLNDIFSQWLISVSTLLSKLKSELEESSSINDENSSPPQFQQFELNVNRFVWSESSRDTNVEGVWSAGLTRKSINPNDSVKSLQQSMKASCLTMKFRVFTPAIQHISGELNDRILDICSDLSKQSGEDHKIIRQVLVKCLLNCFKKLESWIENRSYLHIGASTPDQSENEEDAHYLLLLTLSRCYLALAHICPALPLAFSAVSSESVNSYSISKSSTNNEWLESIRPLNIITRSLTLQALDKMLHPELEIFKQSLLHFTSQKEFLKICPKWEEVKVDNEENNEGNSEENAEITSYSVPSQASWPVHHLLLTISRSINHLGGHTFSRSILTQLIERINDAILQFYTEFLSRHSTEVSQNCAVQMMFDVKLIFSLLCRKKESPSKIKGAQFSDRLQILLDSIEGLIDPFDLEMCMSSLQDRIARSGHRSSLLYGLFASVDRLGSFSSVSSKPSEAMGGSSSHNILPMTSHGSGNLSSQFEQKSSFIASTGPTGTIPRFALLPAVQALGNSSGGGNVVTSSSSISTGKQASLAIIDTELQGSESKNYWFR